MSLRTLITWALSSASIALGSCGGGEPSGETASADCRAGEPTPIFEEDEPGLVRHSFTRRGQSSRELVATATDSLFIEQAGCDTLMQAFTLTVPDSVIAWEQFRPLAAARFTAWAERDARYFAFEQYANALLAVPPDYPTGRPADLAPGLTVRAYPLPTDNPRRWLVRFEQDLTGVATAR